MTATATDGHSVHVVVDVDGPVAYRFHAGGFTSPAGRAAPAVAGAAGLKIAAVDVPALRDRLLRRPPRPRRVGARRRRVPRRLHLRGRRRGPVGADGVVRSHDGPEPTDLAGYRGRYAQYLADAEPAGGPGGVPVVGDLGRPRGREQLRRARCRRTPRSRPSSPRAALAAYQAWWEHMPVRIPKPQAGRRHDHLPHRPLRRPARPRAPRRPPVPQRPGVRRRHAVDRAGVPRGARPVTHDARRDAGGVDRRGASPRRSATWAVLGQQTVLTDLRLPNGAILNEDQWDGYAPARDRLLAAAAPAAGKLVVLTGDIHLAGRRAAARLGTEFVTTSVSSSGLVPAALQPILASVRHDRRRRAAPPRLRPPHRHAGRRGPPSTASSTTSPVADVGRVDVAHVHRPGRGEHPGHRGLTGVVTHPPTTATRRGAGRRG